MSTTTLVQQFFKSKTVKLSDSFVITVNDAVNEFAVGFTLPKFEFDEDVIYYGNTSQKFLIPKYDSIKELAIDFLEDKKHSVGTSLGITKGSFGNKYKNSSETEFSNIYTYNANMKDTATINTIKIEIYDNDFKSVKTTYEFKGIKLTKADMYTLSYQDEAPCKITATFEFSEMTVKTS